MCPASVNWFTSSEVEVARMTISEVTLDREGTEPFLIAGDRSALSRAVEHHWECVAIWQRRPRDVTQPGRYG
jgi:hypothetical protein